MRTKERQEAQDRFINGERTVVATHAFGLGAGDHARGLVQRASAPIARRRGAEAATMGAP